MACYLLGSVPTGYLVGKAKGVDIRTVGSGNMGATNVFRVLGKAAGVFVLIVDGLKGYAACAWVSVLVLKFMPVPDNQVELIKIVAGISAVLGHNFTCWLKFKGGKGVATSAGIYFALAPAAAGIALGVWVVLFALTRYVSVASIAASIVLPAIVWIMSTSLVLQIFTTLLGLLVVIKHKGNIQRLMKGTENRIGRRSTAQEGAK